MNLKYQKKTYLEINFNYYIDKGLKMSNIIHVVGMQAYQHNYEYKTIEDNTVIILIDTDHDIIIDEIMNNLEVEINGLLKLSNSAIIEKSCILANNDFKEIYFKDHENATDHENNFFNKRYDYYYSILEG